MPIRIAGHQALPQQYAQIVGEIGVQLVDRLVLADETTQFLAQRPGARLERGIGEPLGGFDRMGRRSGETRRQRDREGQPTDHQLSADPADVTASEVLAAGRRRRSRRSLSETSPPRAARIAPNQIHGTSGL